MLFINNKRHPNIFKRTPFSIYTWTSVALTIILIGVSSQAMGNETAHHWGYEGGTGPLHWGEIEQDHEKHLMCREGIHQSPINIQDVLGFEKKELRSNYYDTPIQIINNTHSILLQYKLGSYIEWGSEVFELIQFHFHHPSEHQLKGKRYPMEIHFVHKAPDHEYVIIAVLVKLGKHNPHINKIWNNIPVEIDKKEVHPNEKLSAKDFLPSSKVYFHYTGSLTTPPCTENVTWLVLEDPIEISKSQLKVFQKHINHNARPAQKSHHRIIVKSQ